MDSPWLNPVSLLSEKPFAAFPLSCAQYRCVHGVWSSSAVVVVPASIASRIRAWRLPPGRVGLRATQAALSLGQHASWGED